MKRAIRTYWPSFVTIILFAMLSTALGIYTLAQQRVQLPFKDRYKIHATFTATPGLAPGLGQAANVAGVRVGQITDAKVVDGRSVVTLTIERDQLDHVYRDASATLRPNTPLQDLQIDVVPGHRSAGVMPDGGTIPVSRTDVPVAAGSILKALDSDTRQYFTALLSAVGEGFDGRGDDLRRLYKSIGPTADQVTEFSTAVNRRRQTLAQVVHSLSVLAVAAGDRDKQIGRVVDAGAATLRALAVQDKAIKASIRQLPGTLPEARRSLRATTELSSEIRPTLTALRPSTRKLPKALDAADRLTRVATPSTRSTLRPLVAAAIPTLSPLPVAAGHLSAVTPDLSTTFKLLQYLGNELFYSDGGKSKPYAYWAAWAQHNANTVVGNGDANSQALRGALIFGCSTLLGLTQLNVPQLGVTQLPGVVNDLTKLTPTACPAAKGSG